VGDGEKEYGRWARRRQRRRTGWLHERVGGAALMNEADCLGVECARGGQPLIMTQAGGRTHRLGAEGGWSYGESGRR
jgi:hypothetical protein